MTAPRPSPPCLDLDDPAELRACLEGLAAAGRLAPDDPRYLAFERAVAAFVKTGKRKRRAERRRAAQREDRATLDSAEGARAALVRAGAPPVIEGRADRRLNNARVCAVCKVQYHLVHARYPHHCPRCGDLDAAQRAQRVDLRGRRALVTGGRIKIGFELALRLLRDGAHVTVTTRFPRDAAERYARVPDAGDWRDRLAIVPLHLGDLAGLLAWTEVQLQTAPYLDILVNNAAQTVARPPRYYAEWAAVERALGPGDAQLLAAPANARALASFYASCVTPETSTDGALFPPGARDEEGLPLDLRPANSWTLEAPDVPPLEAATVLAVNTLAPFLLTSRLTPLLRRSPSRDRYVVHAAAVEGQFAVASKTPRHPHTNMAKAALNMFTRTSASAFAREGIFMVSVDTGWVTNENPAPARARHREHGFRPPLDAEDGAARLYDPIARGVQGRPLFGVLLKDYAPVPW